MGVTEDELAKTMLKIPEPPCFPQRCLVFRRRRDKISIGDSIESPGSLNPDSMIERENSKGYHPGDTGIADKEKKVLVLYYYES
jgi:RNA polymerase sigma factor for flagellar operon FliA